MEHTTNTAMLSSLREIIKSAADETSVFHDYIEQKKIGKNIFRELHSRLQVIDETKMGFPMDDTSGKIGILSQCQSLQSLVSLAADFGLDFNDEKIIPGQKGSIRQIMDAVIEDIVDRLQVKDENGNVIGYIFDSSPYDSEHYSLEYSNIDTITWTLPSLFLILKYHADIHEVCKWEKELIAIIKYGINYINKAFITGEEAGGEGLAIGWNFTKDCQEPSLYFSFAVCECYLDMFSTFEEVLQHAYAVHNQKKYGLPIDPEILVLHQQKAQEFIENKDKKVHSELEARHDPFNELTRIFRLINDLDEMEDLCISGTLFGDFENLCQTVAEEVWKFVQKDLADKFFYNDLNTTLTESDIRMSTTSDALFNTVYIVNIMIDGGFDEILNLRAAAALHAGNVSEAEQHQRAYNNLLESCQLAIQKAFRTYESLKNDSKDYIVDQFLIGFNEKFETHKTMVNELRKLRMKTFSLLPMLIHSNNVISEYLVKYPQYSMRKYLEYILDNRFVSADKEVHWIWELDGYFSGSNYYYIYALNEFFTYYTKYEKRYIAFSKRNVEREREIIEQHQKLLEAPGGEIAELKASIKEKEDALADKDAEIANLTKALDEFHTPVEDAVREIIQQEVEQRFAGLLAETFSYAAKALTLPQIDATEDTDGVYASICSSLYDMILASIFSRHYRPVLGKSKIKSVEDYNQRAESFQKDVTATIDGYITSINNSTDGSKLKKLFDKN